MLLRLTLKRPADAALLERAVGQVLASGVRTADIAEPGVKPISTREMGDAVLSALEAIGN
jgi:3-isopropylmalate dehydrogenase